MEDWDEYWLDIHSENCKANVQTAQAARIAAAALKGCDGMDPDNVDSVSYLIRCQLELPSHRTERWKADPISTITVILMGILRRMRSIICCKSFEFLLFTQIEMIADETDGCPRRSTTQGCSSVLKMPEILYKARRAKQWLMRLTLASLSHV